MTKRNIHFLEAAMKHKQVVIVLVVLLMIMGINSLVNMPRSENPRIDMPTALVYAIYPGADEHQVEEEVAKKIEQYLFSFEEIKKKKVKSEVREGQVFITTEIYTTVQDRKKFWHTLQLDMDANLRSKLPQGVIGPFINSNFADVTAMIISVSSKERSYAEIEKYLDKLEDGLKVIPMVSKINRSGGQRQQIYIKIDDNKLQQYGLDAGTLMGILQQQNVTGYTGEVSMGSNNIIPVYTNSRYKDENDIAGQIVYTTPSGTIVRLKDVAEIERRFEEKSSFVRIGEDNAMVLSVDMLPGNNIVAFGEEVEAKIKAIQKTFPPDIKMKTIVNQPKDVEHSISHFMKEFGLAIASVLLVVMLLLPFRIAAVASAAAPISMLITFAVMSMLGVELHQVTLAALIIVLGMVVDNAIVVVDNYIEKLDEGIDPWTSAWQAAKQLMIPIFTATLAIIFAFLPLAIFMDGVAKDFMFYLPVAVAIALIVSMLVALLFTPYTCYIFIKKGLKHKISDRPIKKNLLDHLQSTFDKGIEAAFRNPKITIALGVLSVVAAIFIATKVDSEFFPLSERNQFNMEVWMPNGTSLEKTEEKVKELEKILKDDKRVVDVTSFIGMSSPRFHTSYAPETPRKHFAQVFITTTDSDASNEMANEYLDKLKGFMQDGAVKIKQLSFQEGAPIDIRVISENEADQKRTASKIKDILEKTEGANYVRLSNEYDYMGVKLNIDNAKANRLGISNQAITQTLGAGLKGYSISTLWEGDKTVDIFLRFDEKSRKDLTALENLHISTVYGKKVPLKAVATLDPEWHTGMLLRRNGLKMLSVYSEAQLGKKPSRILKEIQPEIDALKLPSGTTIQYGGDEESNAENAPRMVVCLGVSLVLIFLTLLFQFKSLGKSLIVLCTFLLSLFGAFLGLFVTGNPLGMTGFMGIISLIGIVVRNGIILVDYADELIRDHGYKHKAAAIAAAKRRMRPIFLTSAAAAVGVLPMIAGKSPMWAPLGSVLAFGLIFSMILTLFVVPVMYYKFLKNPIIHDEAPDNQPDGQEDVMYKPTH
ncbi:efflux RND transporter permease subunit [Flavobacterium pectinovorum]|uniref:efflux RND transporter permease subunit n=1 Tax=Flavobacterium pectinovorum TaxID=29533 RepID=UPI001FAC40BD|nr:efflux RND transporter permease subunit [Flavobacterium pectinovorum]MCI9845524.1 efflux RND transporter permease subunit [Flavobacterium pectinovorum]